MTRPTTQDVPLTDTEMTELCRLLSQEITDTVSNRKARVLKRILEKLDHASLTLEH